MAVVGDGDDGAGVGVEGVLELIDELGVDGRLVQKQYVTRVCQRDRKVEAATLPDRESPHGAAQLVLAQQSEPPQALDGVLAR